MLKGLDVIGMSIACSDAKIEERIVNWILDIHSNRLLGFVVAQGGWKGGTRILLWESVHRISSRTLEIEMGIPIIEIGQVVKAKEILESPTDIIGCEVITRQGKHIGEITDFYFDPATGDILALAVCKRADVKCNFIPISEPLNLINGLVVATPEMAAQAHKIDPEQDS